MSQPSFGKQKGRRRIIPVAALLLCAAVFGALGGWQVQRLGWKRDLVARVEAGLKAEPVPATTLPFAPTDDAVRAMEYRRVSLNGAYVPEGTVLVAALTDLGNGYWVMTPLRLGDGRMVWVNRGFVPNGSRRDAVAAAMPAVPVSVIGLLRRAEPGRTWLRANDPGQDRWYYRDLTGMSAARGITGSAAWFVDVQTETPVSPKAPVPGLTVVQFANNHLQYAITWFLLCLGSLGAIWLVMRRPALLQDTDPS
ncbi:SURF1 family protein [Novosphingobium sp. FSY-8]|uniref:SURF1-like protein n=1 Tax=Novosphingobium ovatum TaxID=1908523 RepID=A0ABW9XCC4_9SPHN|nr:SURF1 family protein [Novosphingobium ovatum]NBC36201.1 SURF1 family protein [Novosphingobium ovatum]